MAMLCCFASTCIGTQPLVSKNPAPSCIAVNLPSLSKELGCGGLCRATIDLGFFCHWAGHKQQLARLAACRVLSPGNFTPLHRNYQTAFALASTVHQPFLQKAAKDGCHPGQRRTGCLGVSLWQTARFLNP
eukprot:EG_transcript_30115